MWKRFALLLFIVAVVSVSASVSGIMGPPTAELLEGQWSVGYNFMNSEADLGTTSIKWNVYNNVGVIVNDGVANDEIEDFNIARHYGTFSYGLSDLWEVYFQVGFVEAETGLVDGISGTRTELDFDNDLAWGWGTRITLCEKDNVRWGTSLQMNWLDISADVVDASQKTTYEFETMDLLISFGPTVDMGGWQLYGGPFYYSMSGDYSEYGGDFGNLTWDGKADLENESNFGGFIGAQIPLWDNTDMVAEVSFTGDSWAVGTGITWKF